MNPETRQAIIARCAAAQIPIEGAQPENFISATKGHLEGFSGEFFEDVGEVKTIFPFMGVAQGNLPKGPQFFGLQ